MNSVRNTPTQQPEVLPALPKSWSELSWRQLCDVWTCKMQYGGNADVAQAASLLAVCGLKPVVVTDGRSKDEDDMAMLRYDETTGEAIYTLQDSEGRPWMVTPRELSQMAQTMTWFPFPYGDPGKEAVRDKDDKVIEEAVDPVRGYVNPDWMDAMQLPEELIVVHGDRILAGSEWKDITEKPSGALHFQLPAVALYNLTWQQYRSLQAIAPQLFQEGMNEDDILDIHAQFLSHSLIPARPVDNTADHFAPKYDFTYDADRAEQTVQFWRRLLALGTTDDSTTMEAAILFHIVFQVYQTALSYYAQVFPLLFNGSSKDDPLQDALTGETKTLNAIMKYQGYTKPEDVYAENLPVILSTLNTMAEEAKQIEQMNARIKRKH